VLVEKYADRIEQIFARYPDKRSAVMPLLYVAQEEYGWVTPESMDEIAALCEIDRTQVNSIAGYYTMYRESPKGKYWLQVCTDLPCAMRGADQFYKDLLAHLSVEDGGTTGDNMFTVDHVMCLAACDRPQVLQCNFHYHENLDMDKVKALLDEWRADASKPAAKKPASSASKNAPKAQPNTRKGKAGKKPSQQ
jgi:NADH-quinone oxidoreductase E subunit